MPSCRRGTSTTRTRTRSARSRITPRAGAAWPRPWAATWRSCRTCARASSSRSALPSRPARDAVVLEYHGLVTWGDEHERSYGDTDRARRPRPRLPGRAGAVARPGARARPLRVRRGAAARRPAGTALGGRSPQGAVRRRVPARTRRPAGRRSRGRGPRNTGPPPAHRRALDRRAQRGRRGRGRRRIRARLPRLLRAASPPPARRLRHAGAASARRARAGARCRRGRAESDDGSGDGGDRAPQSPRHRSCARRLRPYRVALRGRRLRLRLLADGAVQADPGPSPARPGGTRRGRAAPRCRRRSARRSAPGAPCSQRTRAEADRLGGADALLVPNGCSLSIERRGQEAVVIDGGDPAGIGEAVAFALSGRAPLRDGTRLALRTALEPALSGARRASPATRS